MTILSFINHSFGGGWLAVLCLSLFFGVPLSIMLFPTRCPQCHSTNKEKVGNTEPHKELFWDSEANTYWREITHPIYKCGKCGNEFAG